MEASPTTAATEATAYGTATVAAAVATTITAAIGYRPASVSAAIAVAATVSSITTAITVAIAAVSIAATEPRAGTNEDTAVKPRRTIVTIGRTAIGVSVIVAIATNRRTIVPPIDWPAYPNTHRNLCVRVCSRNQQNTE